jgi:hypothetical protein
MPITPDAICKAYHRKGNITVRALEDDPDTILVEADQEGLEFMGKLFLAVAQMSDCGFQIGPFGAGNALFSNKSTKGLYLHRLHEAATPIQQNGTAKSRRRVKKKAVS